MCLAQGHNTVALVRLEPAASQSRVKHSTTEPLRSDFSDEFPIHINTIIMGLLIVYFKGSEVEFSKLLCIIVPKDCFNLCLFVLILYVPVNNFSVMSQRVLLS